MSKSVLVVEKDSSLSASIRDALAARGFAVEESSDGKNAPELIRRQRPECVVLAVDLDAGQNGYIICKKLKSDDELKSVPVIIVGDPKGFGQHQKLKTRAEDYVGKPLDAEQLAERVGALIGFPEFPAAATSDDGGAFDMSSLVEEEEEVINTAADEVVVDSTGEETLGQDPDFEMVDAMFDEQPAVEEVDLKPPPPAASPRRMHTVAESGFGDDDERTQVGGHPFGGHPAPASTRSPPRPSRAPPPAASIPRSSGSSIEMVEARELRAKVNELNSSLEDANARAQDFESRVRELEGQLDAKQSELDTARTSSSGKSDKDLFALREQVNKKDKEILRLKSELNEKDNELVELRDKENGLEQRLAETGGDTAKKDAQLKTLQTKVDALTSEKRRVDQQLTTAKEEARGATAKLTALQGDFDSQSARLNDLEPELEQLRQAKSELESARQQLDTELFDARNDADASRAQAEQANAELDQLRNQLGSQAATFADEISGLRQRASDAEALVGQAENKANRLQSRVRAQQDVLQRVRESAQQTLALVDQEPQEDVDIELDELAEA